MTPLHTADQCRRKVSELIAEAVAESDDARREGLLSMADQWTDVARRRADLPVSRAPARSASPQGW